MKRKPDPTDPLAAAVAAWHNRHPLSRWVRPRHVQAVGVVALPFLRPEAALAAASPAAAAPPTDDLPHPEPVELTTPLDAAEVELVFDDAPAPAAPAADAAPPTPTPTPTPDEPPHIVADSPSVASAPSPSRTSRLADLKAAVAGLARRARARLPRRATRTAPGLDGLEPAFAADFLAPLDAGRIARFALEHGSLVRPGGEDWPQRDVPPSVTAGVVPVYLRTAAIEVGGQRVRVLIGRGVKPAVVGARLSSPWRAGALSAAVVAAVSSAFLLPGHEAPEGLMAGGAAASAASGASAPGAARVAVGTVGPAAASAALPAGSSVAVAAAQPVTAPASGPALPASSAALVAGMPGTPASVSPSAAPATTPAPPATAAAPPSPASPASAAAPRLAQVPRPAPREGASRMGSIVPPLSEEQRAAARADAERMRGERPVKTASAQAAAGQGAAPAQAASAAGRHFALVTRTTRSRAASEIVQSLMDSAAATTEFPGSPRTEIMAVRSGFRAVWWPFLSEAEAERGREALAAYGIKAEIVIF